MDDPERGWSLSFSGCGFLGIYHVGVTRCLSERAPHLLRDARMFYGTSAGALHCVSFLAGIPLDHVLRRLMDLVRTVRSHHLGILNPSFHMSRYIREHLQKDLPDNVHQLVSGKVAISLTRVADGKNLLVSHFRSKEEVVDAIICSCFIPFFFGVFPPSFRGERYIDGGASDNMPFAELNTTITVSPFYGEQDICPKATSTNFLFMDLKKISMQLCARNAFLFIRTVFPPDLKMLAEICLQGYQDALRFLEHKGICNRPPLDLSYSSEDLPPGSQEHPPPAAPEPRPKPEELLGHLPWDKGVTEALSPELMLALQEALKEPGGYLNKFYNFLPVRVLSYAALPCTLPVELVIAVAHRLVTWLPDVLDDIQWVSHTLSSQALKRLLPTPRFQTPPGGQEPSCTNQRPRNPF